MTYFILIRHGDTMWTKEKRYQGSTDTPLSPRGRRGIRGLARLFRPVDADLIYTSALRRSKESGKIIAQAMGKKIVEDAQLNEVGFGRWEGKTAQELLDDNDPAYKKWMKGSFVTPPGGESLDAFKKRVKKFLQHCLKHHKDKRIVIVSHSGTIRMLLLEILGLANKYMFHFRIDPASVSVIKHYTGSAQLVCLNNIFSGKGMDFPWILKK